MSQFTATSSNHTPTSTPTPTVNHRIPPFTLPKLFTALPLPTDIPRPPSEHSSTLEPLSSTSPYPLPPLSSIIPPLVEPQPTVPRRSLSASDWSHQQQIHVPQPPLFASEWPQQQLHVPQPLPSTSDLTHYEEFEALWLNQGTIPDISHFTSFQEYVKVPISNHPQQPLEWSSKSCTTNDMPVDNTPIHVMFVPTDDPNIFELGNFEFDPNFEFDRSQEIKVSMDSC